MTLAKTDNELANDIMILLEGLNGPLMLERRLDGQWSIDTDAGSSFVFDIVRPTRLELAIAYFQHIYHVETYKQPFFKRLVLVWRLSADMRKSMATSKARRVTRMENFAKHRNVPLRSQA